MRRVVTWLLFVGALVGGWHIADGQAVSELLQNPSFETYYGVGGANVVPTGWKLTSSAPVGTSAHDFPGQSRTGQSWEIHTNGVVFTAIAYQQVAAIPAGTKLHFTAWANVYTCNNKATSCIENGRSYRVSDQSSGARVKIGLDPNGGTDPNASSVLWSGFISPYDVFQQLSVDGTAASGSGVTVYLYATQSVALFLNYAYWDDASLQAGGTGGPAGQSASGGAPFAPVVKPQAAQPDGSIIHTVIAGDTLSSIAVAYKVPVDQLRALNHMAPNSSILQIGQKLIVRAADATAVATLEITPEVLAQAGQDALLPATDAALIPGNVAASMSDLPTVTDIPTSTPIPSTAPTATLPAPSKAEICAVVFEDADGNSLRGSDEGTLPDVLVSLAKPGAALQTTRTASDGTACFTIPEAGTYTVAANATGYTATTPNPIGMASRPGASLQLSFGFRPAVAATGATTIARLATPASDPAPSDSASTPSSITLIVLGIAAAVSIMLCIGGTVGLVLLLRRK